jgi:hypothetical protein
MSKKLLAGFASVLAVAAFAVLPVAAQAVPHYYVNGAKLKEGTAFAKTSVLWGTITLKGTQGNPVGHVTCHTAAAGTLFNPTGGGAGEGLTQQYAPFACEQELICPTKTTSEALVAENLPWANVLTEEVAGTIRQETTGVKLDLVCREGTVIIGEPRFAVAPAERGPRPKAVEGTEALHPGIREFDTPGSGELELEGSSNGVHVRFEGAVKLLGYNAQELIAVKNP